MSRIAPSGGIRQREPRVRDKRHLGRVAKLSCLPCLIRRGVRVWPVQVCHIRVGYPEAGDGWREFGGAEKPHDWRTYPACPSCHLDGPGAQHRTNERTWWENLGVHPPELCAALVEAFSCGQSGEKVLQRFAQKARAACIGRGGMP